MKISIHQPNYLPYIGLFYKISKSDIFVFLDDAQYSKGNLHDCNWIKGANGIIKLKVPVAYKFGDKLNEIVTKDRLDWKERHLKSISLNYKKAPYYLSVFPLIEAFLMGKYDNLAIMNEVFIIVVTRKFGFDTRFYRSSDLGIFSKKEKRVIEIVSDLCGDEYISGTGAECYQKEEHFLENGIKLTYSDYHSFKYNQLWQKAGFIDNLSVIDFLFNYGFDWNKVLELMEVEDGKGDI